jgi:hypothetical protein
VSVGNGRVAVRPAAGEDRLAVRQLVTDLTR